MITLQRTLATAAAILMLIAMWPGQEARAIPASLLMFYGEPLKKSVLVSGDDARAFGDLQQTGSAAPSTAGRNFIAVAIFYGPANDPAVRGVPPDQLTPQMAWQHGRYYPATAKDPALFLVTNMQVKQMKMATAPMPDANTRFISMGPLSPNALAVLKRLGIPTQSK